MKAFKAQGLSFVLAGSHDRRRQAHFLGDFFALTDGQAGPTDCGITERGNERQQLIVSGLVTSPGGGDGFPRNLLLAIVSCHRAPVGKGGGLNSRWGQGVSLRSVPTRRTAIPWGRCRGAFQTSDRFGRLFGLLYSHYLFVRRFANCIRRQKFFRPGRERLMGNRS